MNRLAVLQRHDAEDAPSELGNDPPVPYPTVRLNFLPERAGDDPFAPLTLDVGPLAQDLLLEIARRPHEWGEL